MSGRGHITLIAWDGQTVAADGQMLYGATRASGGYRKIRVAADDTVYAFTGTASLFESMIKWFEGGAKPEERPLFGEDAAGSTLIVWRDGRCFSYRLETPYPCECFAPDAWGSSVVYALGAMDGGATAIKAVELAIKREVYIGGPVAWVELKRSADGVRFTASEGGACA